MLSEYLPYLIPMLLGSTIDLRKYILDGSIFDYANYTETPVNTLKTTYYVLQGDSYPYSQLGLPIDVVLRLKSDHLSTSSGPMGLSGFLKDTSWKYNSVVVAAVTEYRTVDRSLMKNATAVSNWKGKIPSSQTHYADKMIYGAWCVVLFKIKCDIPGDVKVVRQIVTETLGEKGDFGKQTADLWDKALKVIEENKDMRGKIQVSTSVYSTVPIGSFISTPQSYVNVLSKFKDIVTSPGQAIYMTLKPIHDLDASYDNVEGNYDSVSDLEKIDEMFDDLKITKDNLVRWTTGSITPFSNKDEKRIHSLLEKVNSALRAIRKVIEDASLYKEMSGRIIGPAFNAYLSGLDRAMGIFKLKYMKLREKIDAQCENSFHHKIKGLLRVYEDEFIKKGKVNGGLEECQKYCIEDKRCRAVGFSSHASQKDPSTGLSIEKENECWIYYRSTKTALVHTPSDLVGDMGIYDRKCYL